MSDDKLGKFDLFALLEEFPDSAETMLLDKYLNDKQTASTRLFRAYRDIPAHYHTQCDEVLYVLTGEGKFWMENEGNLTLFKPGDLIIFPKNTVHCFPELLKHPVVFLAIDTPRRDPDDITFIDPQNGGSEEFISNKW